MGHGPQKSHTHTCATSFVMQMQLGCLVLDFPPSPSSLPTNGQELKDRSLRSGLTKPHQSSFPFLNAKSNLGASDCIIWCWMFADVSVPCFSSLVFTQGSNSGPNKMFQLKSFVAFKFVLGKSKDHWVSAAQIQLKTNETSKVERGSFECQLIHWKIACRTKKHCHWWRKMGVLVFCTQVFSQTASDWDKMS